jgi:hypothetical protein
VWGGWLAEAAYVLYQAMDLLFGQSRVQEGVRIFFVLRAVSDGIAEVRITHVLEGAGEKTLCFGGSRQQSRYAIRPSQRKRQHHYKNRVALPRFYLPW